MVKVFVLIFTDPGQTDTVLEALKANPEISGAFQVMGPYDIIAEANVSNLNEVRRMENRVLSINGVESTRCCTTFPEES